MSDELATPGSVERSRDRDLDAEFVRAVRLVADAFDLGRVKRIDLLAALVLPLLAHREGE
jgi:hypothetical protein